jgi:hypothetical protein
MSEAFQRLLTALVDLAAQFDAPVQVLVAAAGVHLAVRGAWHVPGDLCRAAYHTARGAYLAVAGIVAWFKKPSRMAQIRKDMADLRRTILDLKEELGAV